MSAHEIAIIKAWVESSSSQAQESLGDNGDDGRLDAIEQPLDPRKGPVFGVRPCQSHHAEHGRNDERHSRHDQAGPTPAQVPNVNRELRRIGARDEIAGRNEIEETLIVHPATPLHDLLAHHGDVRGRASEADRPEFQEQDG